ncbi:hypothetical protein [Emticicia sp. BO119]|uniref:hypothetical protein n=1 Tax=Emticicia sp. BO119 TaxID=2757768 RepID=UPI0015F026F2|nr:hypothetical protein [Emticicia sp. BO119]MBA4852945.1 hypothetical protein [Emticicia sp. BO119]
MSSQTPKDFLKFLKNPDFIDGIYNYCDSWCDRCAFTDKCMNFAMRKYKEDQSRQTSTEDSLTEVFQQTTDLIKQLIEEKGMSWEEVVSQADTATPIIDPHKEANKHRNVKAAKEYTYLYGSFLKKEQGFMKGKGVEFQNDLNKGLISVEEAEKALLRIEDAFEVINWYQSLIYIKIRNACQLFFEEDLSDFMIDYYNGKAKLTLISIDRSLAAWLVLQVHFPEKANKISEILLHLEKLRRQIEKDFPNARKFVRPGLDR